MDIFEILRKYLVILGIRSNQSAHGHRLNARNSALLFVFAMNITADIMYVHRGSDNFEETVKVIFSVLTVFMAAVAFAALIWKTPLIFIFFDNLEKTIQNSKCRISISAYIFVIYLIFPWFCREWWSYIKNNSFAKHPESWKLDPNLSFRFHKIDNHLSDISTIHHQLLHLFHYWFGERCLQIAVPSLVWLKTVRFDSLAESSSMNLFSTFILFSIVESEGIQLIGEVHLAMWLLAVYNLFLHLKLWSQRSVLQFSALNHLLCWFH